MIRFRCTECSYSATLSHRQAQEKNLHGGEPICPECAARINFLRPSDEIKGLLTVFVLAAALALSLYQGPPANGFWRGLRLVVVLLTFLPGGWWLFLNVAFWCKFKGADASVASIIGMLFVATAGQLLLLYLWIGRWTPASS